MFGAVLSTDAASCAGENASARVEFQNRLETDPARALEVALGFIRQSVNRNLPRCRNGIELEDLCQDVIVHLCENNYRRLCSYDASRASPRTWIEAVVRHFIEDQRRRHQSCTVREIDHADSNAGSPEDNVYRAELEGMLTRTVAQLGAGEVALLNELLEHGFDFPKAAEGLKISPGALYQGKRRLIGKLRKLIHHQMKLHRGR
jgi:RNA polymerase sigma factor (sigma-70 family)